MTPAITPCRSGQRAGRDGFAQLLHAEWTEFRTVRGWVITIVAAALTVVLVALLAGASSGQMTCRPFRSDRAVSRLPTASTSCTGRWPETAASPSPFAALRDSISMGLQPGLVPSAKAGPIIKAGHPAGIALRRAHGHRRPWRAASHDSRTDSPASPARSRRRLPRWLRLSRSGECRGYESADGARWTKVGSVHLAGLGPPCKAGCSSPRRLTSRVGTAPSVATAIFGGLRIRGGWLGGTGAVTRWAPNPQFTGYPPNIASGGLRSLAAASP